MRKSYDGIEYEYIDPTGNITVLVTTLVDIKSQPEIADMIMKMEPTCEQVGFVGFSDKGDIKLRMAAGEFCGNATMSTAALLCDKRGMSEGESKSVIVESSGCKDLVGVNITRNKDSDNIHVYSGQVDMPLPKRIRRCDFTFRGSVYELPVVEFDGISHIIMNESVNILSDMEAEDAVRKWCDDISADALGIMKISSETISVSEDKSNDYNIEINMRPLVYVKEINSLFWENSCASGTTAVGAYYVNQHKGASISLTAHEPGGVLSVFSRNDGHLILSGTVYFPL